MGALIGGLENAGDTQQDNGTEAGSNSRLTAKDISHDISLKTYYAVRQCHS